MGSTESGEGGGGWSWGKASVTRQNTAISLYVFVLLISNYYVDIEIILNIEVL